MNLLLFCLVSLSVTNIIQNEQIFSWFRKLIKKLSIKTYNWLVCPTCFGWWIGLLLSFVFILHTNIVLNMFICSFVSSIVNKIFATLVPKQFDLE